jgi:Uma2 family endonuclease
MSEAIAQVGLEEFLAAEQDSERRHELVGGRVYAMAGGSERHDLAATLLFGILAPPALAAGCRPFTANRLVYTRLGAGYYPDIMIACGPAPDRLYETDPTVVIEVLSPSTANVDRREKALAYAASPELRLLMLVDPEQRRIEVATVHHGVLAWDVRGPGEVIRTGYGDVDVDALYDALDAAATTT